MEERTSPRGPHNLTFGSLFAGVGGFDLGFEAAGWTPRWQVEWDARCRSVLERHWPQVARYGDVRDVGVLSLAGRSDDGFDGRGLQPDVDGQENTCNLLEPVHCITYGFPCQDLSVAGRRAGLDGDRSGLFFEATRIIKEMRDASGGRYPTWAVAENVCGLLSADRGAAMGRCLNTLADIGAVDIEWGVVDAQYFGVPQRRKRVFIVARFGTGDIGPKPLLPLSKGRARHPQAGAAQGQGTSGGAEIGAGGGGGGHGMMARPGLRRLTPRECERLMGWPEDHTRWGVDGKEIPDTTRYAMCGNGVVAPVSQWIAKQIREALDAGV